MLCPFHLTDSVYTHVAHIWSRGNHDIQYVHVEEGLTTTKILRNALRGNKCIVFQMQTWKLLFSCFFAKQNLVES